MIEGAKQTFQHQGEGTKTIEDPTIQGSWAGEIRQIGLEYVGDEKNTLHSQRVRIVFYRGFYRVFF